MSLGRGIRGFSVMILACLGRDNRGTSALEYAILSAVILGALFAVFADPLDGLLAVFYDGVIRSLAANISTLS
jgi:Flp pilus assembly pilin Flp